MNPTAVIVLAFPDGSVGRMQYYTDPATDSGIQAAIDKSPFPAGRPVSWKRGKLSDFPADPSFRSAWTITKGKIDVDMTKAVEIHKSKLRALREPILAALDLAYLRADETKDEVAKAEIIAQKELLRGVTDDPALLAAKTPDELKAVIPDILKV